MDPARSEALGDEVGDIDSQRDRGWRRRFPAGGIELLNVHWHELRDGLCPRSCPVCDANVAAGDQAVHHGGELYHPACARNRRERA